MNTNEAKKIAAKNYTYIIERELDDNGSAYYFARVLEFQGCFGQGDTPDEALEDVKLALIDMIDVMLKLGQEIPLANQTIKFSKGNVENKYRPTALSAAIAQMPAWWNG